MASNQIPKNTDLLISLASDAANGAAAQGAAINLAQNTAAKIRADLTAFIGDPAAVPPIAGAQNTWNAAKSAKVAATAARRTAEDTGRAFATKSVNLLKNFLGNSWNAAWQAAGFTAGSLAIPDDPLSLLSEIRAYFQAHPAQENAPLSATAAAATAQITAITTARTASNNSVQALGTAKALSDAALRALSQRLSGLRTELDQLLSDEDPRWYAFGFDRPADGWQPGPVEHLTLTPGTPGHLFADWDDARRAERYRVTAQLPGQPPLYTNSSVLDSELTLPGLPSGATLLITVTALNPAGESPPATATLTVP